MSNAFSNAWNPAQVPLFLQVKFAHIYALQLAQKGSILEKKMGYLACALFLSESDDLILLLVNTIVRDLGSKNIMVRP